MSTRCITLEEAKKSFFPKPMNMPLDRNTFFSFTPDPEDPSFEYVHYWIERQSFNAQLSFNEGYIYILENKSLPGILKIGYTDRSPLDRVREINAGTGVIIPWHISTTFPCKSPNHIETLVHQSLSQYRLNKEGFNVSISLAEEIIQKIIDENNAHIE